MVVIDQKELKKNDSNVEKKSNKKAFKKEEFYGIYDSISTVITKTVEDITTNFGEKNSSDEVSIGVPNLTLHKGDLIVLGSRPALGKTSFACSVIRKLGIEEKRPVGLITTGSMDYTIFGEKMLCMESHVPYYKIRSGFMNHDDIEHLKTAAGRIFEAPIFLQDTPNGSFAEIEFAIRCMVQEQKVEIVFIDSFEYLDEIANSEKYDELCPKTELLKEYKNLARRLNVPIVILMEMPESGNGSEPCINEFRKDMIIPRTADMVIFLHRNRAKEECEEIPSKLIVAKNEHGNTGDYPVMFRPEIGKFVWGEK